LKGYMIQCLLKCFQSVMDFNVSFLLF
jgi:hypothetical protein